MKLLSWLGIAAVALIATSCASTFDNSRTGPSSRYGDVSDFNGDWHLVQGRSDYGSAWMDARSRFGADWGDDRRMNDDAWFLPDDFRLVADRGTLRIEDENGGSIADIPMDNGYRYGSYGDRDNDNGDLQARWVSDRRIQVERTGRSGRRMTESFSLENRRSTLVVSTQVDRDGSTRTYTRVYERS